MNTPQISDLNTVYLPPQEAVIESSGEPVRAPILVVLHGLGDSVEGYRFLPEVLRLPKLSYLLVNAPDDYFTGFSWFDIMGDPAPGIIRSRNLLFKLFDQLIEQGWAPQDLGLFGFSQGGLLTLDLAARYPNKLAGLLAISGYVYFLEEYPAAFSAVAKEQKIFATHGTLDPMLPCQVSRQQVAELKKMGLDIRWREYAKEHTIDPVQEVGDIITFLRENFRI